MMRLLLALLPLLASLAACGSPCQDLAERICECELAGAIRDNCKASVRNQIGSGVQKPDDQAQEFCRAKLETCPNPASSPDQCNVLRTPAGKEACGIAFPPAGS
jgi:hypothetical protein